MVYRKFAFKGTARTKNKHFTLLMQKKHNLPQNLPDDSVITKAKKNNYSQFHHSEIPILVSQCETGANKSILNYKKFLKILNI